MKKPFGLWVLAVAVPIFLGAAASTALSATEHSECTGTVSLNPEHNFQFTSPEISGHRLTFSIDMEPDIVAILSGDAALDILTSSLDGDGTVTSLTPSGELTIVATGDDSWTFSYNLAGTYAEPADETATIELECESLTAPPSDEA